MTEPWRAIISKEEEQAKAEKLPKWVKCVYCGGRPKYDDLLGELIKNSNALAHQSCARQRGLMFGMNAGTIQEIGGSLKAPEEEKSE